METLTGKVSEVSYSTMQMGEYGENTLHIATLRLDGTHLVRIEAPHRPKVDDGELIAVAGSPRGCVLRVLAYENLSKCQKGNVGKAEAFFGGLTFLAFAKWLATGHVAALAVLAGAWLLIRSARIGLAEHDLKHDARSRRQLIVASRPSRSDA